MTTFYATIDSDSVRAYMPDVPVMLPASSWARKGMRAPGLPEHVQERAADCGGFVATLIWGDYRYSNTEYVAWLETFGPSWAAMKDYCCEDEITAGKPGIVRERQDKTTEQVYRFWQDYRAAPWVWAPTVQGWNVDEYRRHAAELRPIIHEMSLHYGPGSAFRVGIGTLCRRASNQMIRAVVSAVADELPGIPLHLWGVKLGFIQSRVALHPQIASVDSAAWNGFIKRGHDAWRASRLSKRQYAYTVAIHDYRAKFDRALRQPKQHELFG